MKRAAAVPESREEEQLQVPRPNRGAKEPADERSRAAADVSVAILNFNGRDVLPGCLKSIGVLAHPPGEVLLVDDGSTDGSPEWVADNHPFVRIVEFGANTGRLNKVRNRALEEAANELVLLLDNDILLEPDALDRLVNALATLPHAAACSPRLLYEHDPRMIYQDAQTLHYVGATLAVSRNVPSIRAEHRPRLSIGLGGVQLIDRQKAAEVGGFNEEYVMGWGDDGEFNYRMNLSGRLCYHVPQALAFHKRVSGARRYIGSTTNRWRFILECYQLRTLLMCAPALLLYEIALAGFLVAKANLRAYFRAQVYILRNLPSILAARRATQRTRRIPDRELITSGDLFIASEYVDSGPLRVGLIALNWLLNTYWSFARVLL